MRGLIASIEARAAIAELGRCEALQGTHGSESGVGTVNAAGRMSIKLGQGSGSAG